MKEEEFKQQLSVLQNLDIQGLRDEDIPSYVRVYYALYNLVSVNALDAEYGDRKVYLEQLNALSGLLEKKYEESNDIADKARYMDILYFILHATSFSINREKEDLYWDQSVALIDQFLEIYGPDDTNPTALYPILRLIFVVWSGLEDDDDAALPPHLDFAYQQIEKWMNELDPQGRWNQLSNHDALRRISVLSMNSYMMLDRQYDDLLNQLIQTYGLHELEATSITIDEAHLIEQINYYTLLYDVLQQSPLTAPDYNQYLRIIAERMERIGEDNHLSSSLSLKCKAIAIDAECWKISEEAQMELFE